MKIALKFLFVLMVGIMILRWPTKASAQGGPPPGCSGAGATCNNECLASCGAQGQQCDNSCTALYADDPYAIENCTTQCSSMFQQCMTSCIGECVAGLCTP